MDTLHTNTSSLILQSNLKKTQNAIETSIERLSTGFRLNHACDDAANMAISKNMECQISGTDVALDNTQQGVNLLQTADDSLDIMQSNLQKIRDLTVQAMNGTYSTEEKAMIQEEVNKLLEEIYRQRNTTTFNQIKVFGTEEVCPVTSGSESSSATATTGNVGTHEVTKLTEAEAIAQGYTCIHNETEFKSMVTDGEITGKYCLMGDIDFSKISGWGDVTLESGGEVNGNGYAVNNLTINSTTNTDMHGLFRDNAGTIKNLNMNNVSIDSTNNNIGGLVGGGSGTTGTIDNCSVSGSIKGGDMIGGLVGYSGRGTITNSSSSGNVTGDYYTGGLVGDNNASINNSTSSCYVIGDDITGGFIGYNSGTITKCTSSGEVFGATTTGGLIGQTSGDIINCSSSAIVTGTSYSTGGLVGENSGNITKSYMTGSVSGNRDVGGIAGIHIIRNITDSYSIGNISGAERVGGAVGVNIGNLCNAYSTGEVTCTGTSGGGLIGANGFIIEGMEIEGTISNSYTTSELDFYGNNIKGTISNCHGTTTQTGVTAHDAEWFKDGKNLSFLGSAYDTSIIPPEIIDNRRAPKLVDTSITFQVGANSGEENTITVDTGFSLNNLSVDIMTLESCETSLDTIDATLNSMSAKRSEIGSYQNRLESVTNQLTTEKINLESSLSSIKDTDYAEETSKLTKNQILHSVNASLLAQENINQQLALKLLT